MAVASSARLEELQRRAAALRAELHDVEAAIAAEEALLSSAAPNEPAEAKPQLHHRPSWSLLAGAEGETGSPIRQVSAQDTEKLLASYPSLNVGPIGQYNHWDRRECAVGNAAEWIERCKRYMTEELGGKAEIPKVIHQIWIGPKEPPCLWIDTFRVEYLATYPEWGYVLWNDDLVSKLPMINDKIYQEEKMWQCKADILRLEFLWHHGGLYVDADMISVENKSLDAILEIGRDTGFVIAYEPDTKDKPYSILGNSVIACTPHHPLILMLILYLKHTYYHKRNVADVFIVTGPVMYTKCLVDSRMPLAIAEQELLYPAFHYVPNPDAIDFSRFPRCLMFQFGYTCSGLEGYVKRKNRCKKARGCAFHACKEWPMGGFRELPTAEAVEQQFAAAGRPPVARVVHQLVLGGVDSPSDPGRWRRSWWEGFKRQHPEFEYRTWSAEQLRGRRWLCANLYVEPLDDHAATVLMLELLFEEGGFYAPLASTWQGQGRDAFFDQPGEFLEGSSGVFGAAKGSPECFRHILELYNKGQVGPMRPAGPSGPCALQSGFRDGTVCRAHFGSETRYLGAAAVVSFSSDARLDLAAISWAYESQVPCLSVKGLQAMRAAVVEGGVGTKAIFISDYEFFQMQRLKQELPALLDRLGNSGWDVMLLGVEWNTGSEEVVLFQVPPGGRPRNCKVAGFVANLGNPRTPQPLRAALAASLADKGFDPSPLFAAAGSVALHFGAEKYGGSIEEARILRSMPLVDRVFRQLANHHPPMHYDRSELHGNLMKGFLHGMLRFEMILEPTGGIMFRAWNEDNSTNCEVKTSEAVVEWMKVFYNHQVVFEDRNRSLG